MKRKDSTLVRPFYSILFPRFFPYAEDRMEERWLCVDLFSG